MSAGNSLRLWLEGLALGTLGSGYSIVADRFHLLSPDKTIETHPSDSIERAIEIAIVSGSDLSPRNHYDGFVLRRYRVAVRVGYAYTKAGGDLAEGLTEQHGEATLNAIQDRAESDHLDLMRVFADPNNRGASEPSIFAILSEDEYELTEGTDRCVLNFELEIHARVSTTSAQAT